MRYLLFLIFFFLQITLYANEIDDIDIYLLENIEQEITEQKVLVISKQEEEELYDLLNRGELLFSEQKFTDALKLYNLALSITQKYNLSLYQLKTLINIANIHHYQEEYLLSIYALNQALEIINTIDENNAKEEYLAYIYSRLAYAHYNNDPKLSKIYLDLAIKENLLYNNHDALLENYYNAVIINKKIGALDEAKISKNKYLEYSHKVKNKKFFKLFVSKEDNKYRYNLTQNSGSELIIGEYVEIQILNKINGFTYLYEMRVGSKITINNINIITRACYKSAPRSLPENMGLFEVQEMNNDNINNIFLGWMFSSTPSLNSMEHAIYDIRLLNCQVKNI